MIETLWILVYLLLSMVKIYRIFTFFFIYTHLWHFLSVSIHSWCRKNTHLRKGRYVQILILFKVDRWQHYLNKLSFLCCQPGMILYLYLHKLYNQHISYLFSLKNSRTCRDLNPGPPWYQANMLPIELFWLG